MKTSMVQHVVRSGGLALALMLCLTTTLSAQESRTTEACQQRINSLIASHRLRINPPTRARAVQYCVAGEMDRARALLERSHAESSAEARTRCLQTVDSLAHRVTPTPSSDVVAEAKRRCESGDLQGAIALMKGTPSPLPRPPSPRPQAPPASEAERLTRQCLLDLEIFIRRTGRRPTEATYAQAQRHCHSGDSRAAVETIRTGDQQPTPPPANQRTPAECERSLDTFIARTGIRPDERTYAAAKAHCASGDTRRAIETVRNSVRPR